ncbi:PIN-like domain-containing protein [Pseudomonas chlororaphis]|uniref:PIN-like domain-containing protein n=1 Tax=Pseudomonas chlororaphis TaxID=587753 RepID=UPI000407DACA|nr:PIN domain-containing protein [Pseudomonas chlororaphis]
MKKEFPGFFANGTSDIESLWDECIFVLDANVLLSLYRYSDSTRSELLQVFDALADRLWIPNQVAFEYLNNRLTVIGEQSKIYDDAIKKIETLRKSLENSNQHPFVSKNTLSASIETFEKLIVELNENRSIHEKRINNDEIKDQLEKLLADKVGKIYTKEETEQIIVKGKARYEEKIPPGYCDIKKGGNSTLFSDICKPYGDYIVWLQLIDKSKADDKSVIFITGDVKEDWWLLFNGRTIGPQPQLVEEFQSLTKKTFYMYPPDRFLERANMYLQQETSQQAVDEIRDIRFEESEISSFDQLLNAHWPSSNLAMANDATSPTWRHNLSRKLDILSEEKESLAARLNDVRTYLDDAISRQKSVRTIIQQSSSNGTHINSDNLEIFKKSLASADRSIEKLEMEQRDLLNSLVVIKNQEKAILLEVSNDISTM